MPSVHVPASAMEVTHCAVVATPHIVETYLDDAAECIVLASDGVWDVLSDQQVAAVVAAAPGRNAASAAEGLVKFALRNAQKGDADNTTAAVAFFRQPSTP